MIKRAVLFLSLSLIVVGLLPIMSSTAQQDQPLTLRWNPKAGYAATFMLSTSGTAGQNISVRTENYTIRVDSLDGGVAHFTAHGEIVPDSAPLPFRFQRALFPQFMYTVDPLGEMVVPDGQPFPLFQNVPILPEEPISVGSTWSGGPVGILPDVNVGPIPFTFTSSVTSIEIFKGEKCAVIGTDYKVDFPSGREIDDAVSRTGPGRRRSAGGAGRADRRGGQGFAREQGGNSAERFYCRGGRSENQGMERARCDHSGGRSGNAGEIPREAGRSGDGYCRDAGRGPGCRNNRNRRNAFGLLVQCRQRNSAESGFDVERSEIHINE